MVQWPAKPLGGGGAATPASDAAPAAALEVQVIDSSQRASGLPGIGLEKPSVPSLSWRKV